MEKHNFDEIIERRGTDSVKWNSFGPDVLPMWVADTDFACPEPILRVLRERMKHGLFGYSHDPERSFAKAAAHWMESRFGWTVQPDEVAFSPNVVSALALAVQAFTAPGEGVLILTPSYPPFFSIPVNNGRELVTSSLVGHKKSGYAIDFADLEEKLARPSTGMFMLCSPQNPTGRAFTRDELLRIGELCLKHNVLVLSDEIHCDFVYAPHGHVPFPSLSPELAAISLVTINPSKTFNIADLLCSSVISKNPELLDRFKSFMDRTGLHPGGIGRLAFVAAYTECADYADSMRDYVKANLEYAVAYIRGNIPGVSADMPEASYLLWLDCRGLGLQQPELKRFFLEDAKLALNSGTDFGQEGAGFMRMNLACPRATLRQGLERLERAVKNRS